MRWHALPRLRRPLLERELRLLALTISAVQRNAIHDDVIHDLTGVGDIYIHLGRGDVGAAPRLRRHYEADLPLLDDLGWAVEDPRAQFELTLPTPMLQRALIRLAAIGAARLHDACQPAEDVIAHLAEAVAVSNAAYDELLEATNNQIGGAA